MGDIDVVEVEIVFRRASRANGTGVGGGRAVGSGTKGLSLVVRRNEGDWYNVRSTCPGGLNGVCVIERIAIPRESVRGLKGSRLVWKQIN
jgi:hypothetical protein